MLNNRFGRVALPLLLVLALAVGTAACGGNGASTNPPANATTAAAQSTTAAPAAAADADSFLSPLDPQVLYDKDKIKVTLDVFPDKSPVTYRLTTENGSDQAIVVRLTPFVVDNVAIALRVVNAETNMSNESIAPGATDVSLVRFGELFDFYENIPYRNYGLGLIGDFTTNVQIASDTLSEIDRTDDIEVKTARGYVAPDYTPVTKNLLFDEAGVKLYLISAEKMGDSLIGFNFFYENSLPATLSIESAGIKWDGNAYDSKLYNKLEAGHKGFFSHDVSMSTLAENNIQDPATVQISFTLKNEDDAYKTVLTTTDTDLHLDQFPWLQRD